MALRGRVLSLVGACAALLSSALAHASPIPDSLVQVGPWRVSAYTRDQTSSFDHCSASRVQAEGFTIVFGLSQHGIWVVAAEAPDWGLTTNQVYPTSVGIGENHFTLSGRAANDRVLVFGDVAPEFFSQLKSGASLIVGANARRYLLSLDGVEAAMARTKECTSQYAAQASAPASTSAAGAPSSGLVATIQTLLTRLGYNPGPVNGVVGLRTNIAISMFQKSIGERGDGLPSEAVRGQLERAVAQRTAAAQPPPPPPQPAAPSTRPAPGGQKKEAEAVGSGTGFYIAPDIIVTNFHVAGPCTDIRIRKNGAELGRATPLALSQSDDLAALRATVPAKVYLRLRAGAPIQPAESVLVFGYPLAGALSSTGNTTLGNVTALTGIRDDSRYLQISAAVQPGNSGGPVVDEQGRLMAVVVSKLNALAMAAITGDIAQNVNFAIKVSTLSAFLQAHHITYESDAGSTAALSNVQRAERAEAASMQLECWK